MNQNSDSFSGIINAARHGQVYWEEKAILDFTEELLARLAKLGLSKKDLAEVMDVAPAYVSKLVSGSNNYTLRTMVKVARALGAELRLKMEPVGAQCWRNYEAHMKDGLSRLTSHATPLKPRGSALPRGVSMEAEANRIVVFPSLATIKTDQDGDAAIESAA